MNPFVMVFIRLDAEERQRQQQGAGVEKLELAELIGLARDPGEQRGDGRECEDDGVGRAERNTQPAVRPLFGADAQQDVGGKKPAKEHDLGRQKQPDADLGIVKAGVRPGADGVRDVHFRNAKCGVRNAE